MRRDIAWVFGARVPLVMIERFARESWLAAANRNDGKERPCRTAKGRRNQERARRSA